MCGISGIISVQGFQASQLCEMNDLIHHRGPDGEGYMMIDMKSQIRLAGGRDTDPAVYTSQHNYTPKYPLERSDDSVYRLGFGHRRLSIIDLSPAGHQPLSYGNGRYWITYNGEIYNFHLIKTELEVLGHAFQSRTDTEVILAAYSEWGVSCLNRFVGMWAFAIFDSTSNEVFIARDRYGIKPLYYWFSPERHFCFASEIKQFTNYRGWKARLNKNRSNDFLIYSFTDHTDETMFEGVFQLPAGSYIKARYDEIRPSDTGRLNCQKWYFLKEEHFKGSFLDAADNFRQLFKTSVREHLIADVPVGTALSGGLDSSAIVCEINRLRIEDNGNNLQKTFSSCSEDERFDERKWMEIVINQTKVDAHFVYPQLEDVFKYSKELIWYQDEPYQSQSAFLGFSVFKLAGSNGVKVLLNGQGADEYLGGYGQFTVPRYAMMASQLKFRSMLAGMSNFCNRSGASYSSLLIQIAHHLSPQFVKRGLTSIRSSSDSVKGIIDSKRLGSDIQHPYTKIPVDYGTVREISEHLTFYSTLPKYLRWEDRNSMASSVEARVPFLDHRLVEFCYNLPDEYLEMDGLTKRVMREGLKNLLPEPIRNRKDKMGFITPEELWVRKGAPALFRAKIAEAVDVTGGIIKPEAIKYFDDVVSGKEAFSYTYWRLIVFSEWIQKFKIKI
jgi:asparagine synthase (glutamine-hydrolysing)